MKRFRFHPAPICIVLALLLVHAAIPYQPALAGIIATHEYVAPSGGDSARNQVEQFLGNEAVRNAFINQGVDPEEAAERVQNLSEDEIRFLAQQIENLPAGGNGLGFVIGVLVIVLLVLLILRLA